MKQKKDNIWKAKLKDFQDLDIETRTDVRLYLSFAFVELVTRCPDEYHSCVAKHCSNILDELQKAHTQSRKGYK